jgi:hypothetical protein|tara:strand:- start:1083 stop:1214 length:132 start_codon:yes stop_codon:yes gene_type:complete
LELRQILGLIHDKINSTLENETIKLIQIEEMHFKEMYEVAKDR